MKISLSTANLLSNDFTIPQNQWFNFDDDYILCDMLGQRMELKLV